MLYYIILLHVGMFILYYLVISLFSVVLFIGYIYLFIVENEFIVQEAPNVLLIRVIKVFHNAMIMLELLWVRKVKVHKFVASLRRSCVSLNLSGVCVL